MSSTREPKKLSKEQLRSAEHDALAHLAKIRAADPPQTPEARDQVIADARATRDRLHTTRAEISRRETHEKNIIARMWAAPGNRKNRSEEENARIDKGVAERKAHHAEMKAAQDARNAAELQRRREAGLLYEPTDPSGGDTVAALFSSSVLWGYTETKIQQDGFVGQILDARHIITLWWAANLIAEHGGESASYPRERPPHWPDPDREFPFRDSDLAHLAANKLLEVEFGSGSGSLVTLRFGSRAKAIVNSYRESIGKKATRESHSA